MESQQAAWTRTQEALDVFNKLSEGKAREYAAELVRLAFQVEAPEYLRGAGHLTADQIRAMILKAQGVA